MLSPPDFEVVVDAEWWSHLSAVVVLLVITAVVWVWLPGDRD